MHTYTALYDTREDAERVQAQLQQLGIIDKDGQSLHDRDSAGLNDSGSGGNLWSSGRGVAPPEDDRRLYEESLRRGGYLLTVNVDDEEDAEVRRVLEASNPVDIDTREQEYRSQGILGGTGAGAAAGGVVGAVKSAAGKVADAVTPDSNDNQGATFTENRDATFAQSGTRTEGEQAIPIVQEQLRVGKRSVERGGVRIRAYTVETPVNEQVTLREEHVNIERRPVDQRLTGAIDSNLLQERTIEVTETAEEAVVAKEARVVEELVVNKEASEHTETIQDTVRHTEVDVERLPGSTTDRPLQR